MSSDVDDDQVLPDSLQKLEIVPDYSHSQSACKANNEHNNQNPFFSQLSTANDIDERITKDLFGPTCSNCKSIDSSKSCGNKSWRHRGSNVSQCIEHNINKQIHFKHRDKEKSQVLSEKKLTILREPILKSIGRSIYHNGTQSKSCCDSKPATEQKQSKTNVMENVRNTLWFGPKSCDQGANVELKANCAITKSNRTELSTTKLDECQQVSDTTDTNNVMMHRIQNWQLNDNSNVIDFKSLVNECDNLSLSTPEPAINSIIELHKTKNFQVLQANQIENDAATAAASVVASLTNETTNDSTNSSNNRMIVGAGISAMNNSMSSNSSNSSSCSQQARMNSSNCDVTIDELASYIEFQLHLPKPMSTNVYEAMFS
ncbi:uncharacterized protein LOC116351517 [Contarinia nasturtii]|uniref:uncharacterized protein LOC116351502 n=1 Tax=Contarinia nasturtii TaxID=265458 RepID=UPI0012D4B3B6|nr:uncharacterized protein LOC116351502 [Contarinia nasturtii]XP_031639466.1 uncharacterized protein LOC116351502 [Contarinia nasturtii]XP_031639494.1 uncharacterized protein LOC116351517 [Contarinia nasturtii]XP_031639495.1 uncharacterized protein LOC116351517 [Contarinia nasturtii]